MNTNPRQLSIAAIPSAFAALHLVGRDSRGRFAPVRVEREYNPLEHREGFRFRLVAGDRQSPITIGLPLLLDVIEHYQAHPSVKLLGAWK